jgi:HAE1 family hydrophobic/amphiphilic exporter-1
MVFGLFSLNNLAIDMYPETDIPALSVITTYQGANASDIETNITKVLEDNLNTVNNLKKLTSKSSDNVSLITLELEWGSNIDEAANDVRDVIGRVTSLLPDNADSPIIMKFSSSMIPVMVLTATANESYAGLYKILDDRLVNVLNRIDGVGAVSVVGRPVRQIQVNVDPNKLDAYNLSVEQLGQIVAAENVNVPGGTLDIGNNTFNIKSDNEFKSSDDLKEIMIANQNGKNIFLRDVATIKDTLETNTMDERVNGSLGMRVIVQKQSGANSVQIAKSVKQTLEKIQQTLPPDVKIGIVMDGSESIIDSINSLSETVMYAFLFVIIVVLFFLGRWRATFIICLTIPVSLIVAFIYLFVTGNTLNIISLSSLSIAIGMVVDDAIVVLENITKHVERGSDPKEASIYATNEVWLAVIATTLTVVAVFLPLTMMTGMAGIMFKQLGWIVTLVVVVSTIAAITLTPMLSSLLLKLEGNTHTYKGLGIIFKPIDKFLDKLDNGYAKLLTWAVRHRSLVVICAALTFIASLFLVRQVPVEMFNASDNATISAEIQLQQNIGVNYTSKIARQIDSIIYNKYPEIYILSTSAGQPSENNTFTAMRTTGSYIINYMMRLHKKSQRERTIFEISDLFREDLAQIPEIRQYKVQPGGSMGGGIGGVSNIAVKVFGYDLDETNRIALDLQSKIAKLDGTRDVLLSRDDMRPEFNIDFDRNKLAAYGLTSATAASYVRNRINGLTATQYREDGDEYDVIVRYDEPHRKTLDDVENIVIYNNAQPPQGVKIKEIADVNEVFAPPAIERENRQRLVTVNVAMANNVPLGIVAESINGLLADYELPDGIHIEMGGTLEDQQDAFSDIMMLALLIIVLVYIVMATQFESFKMPFIIMFSVMFAFTGVFLALWMTGTALSMVALIGAIMLIGIVVKNGIVMVDYINLMRERGSSINQAVIISGKSRLRPVLMTSLTTILGMLPLAIGGGEGSEIWKPMGISIIGGLTFSTLLTLLVVPVLYSIFGAVGLKKEKKVLSHKQRDKQQKQLEPSQN